MIFVGCSGHRPPRLGMAYDDRASILTFEGFASEQLRQLSRIEAVVSGMGLGWDQALAEAAIALKIPLIAAIPFQNYWSRWSAEARKKTERILSKAEKVVVVCGEEDKRSFTDKYLDRDRYVVDMVNLMLVLWDGQKDGGTWQAVKYAKKRGVKIKNVYDAWLDEGRPGVKRHVF